MHSENEIKNRSALGLAMRAGQLPKGLHFNVDEEVEETEDLESDVNENPNGTQQLAALNALLSDPDVLSVIKAKREGKKVSVKEEAEEEEPQEEEVEEPDPLKDIKDDDPLKETLTRLSNLIDTKLDRTLKKLNLDELNERLNGIETKALDDQRKEVSAQVKAVREKYADFDEFKAKILELSKSNPGLSLEEMYFLAKSRSGKLKLDRPSTFSEKPSASPRKPGLRRKTPERPPGKRGFNQMLEEALEGKDFELE